MIFEPRAAVLHPVNVENALVRAAVGDYADEAAVLLLINLGHWLLQLQSAGLISYVPDGEGHGRGSTGPNCMRRCAPEPVDLGDLAGGLSGQSVPPSLGRSR